jgi:two-component system response regulator AtoC
MKENDVVHSKRILVVEDDMVTSRIVEAFLKKLGYQVTTAASGEEALLAVEFDRPEVVLSDINLPGTNGLELQKKIKEIAPHITVIMMTAKDDMTTTIQAMQQGAYDYITKPIDFERLQIILSHLSTTQELSEKLSIRTEQEAKEYQLDNVLVGRNKGMIDIYKTIGSVAQTKVTVLIEGESGTGKELIARAIHFNSPVRDEPFIAVNCTALSETLLESELFGHEKGSFTGATGEKQGKFELARGGTIFLDEIGEISHSIQVKLLRILQQREFERVGGEKSIQMRARVVAATNRDLKKEVAKGNFREDLFYRLNVVSVHVPPLRDRKEDLPMLVKHLLKRINEELHTKVWKLSEGAEERILDHDWPGNVRELENVLTRAVVLSKTDVLEEDNLPQPSHTFVPDISTDDLRWRRTLAEVEREHMLRVLKNVNGNRTEAARILGISKQTLYSKLPKD